MLRSDGGEGPQIEATEVLTLGHLHEVIVLERGPGGIGNADDTFLGPMVPRLALARSRNVPAVGVLDRVGLDEVYALLRDLGLREGKEPARLDDTSRDWLQQMGLDELVGPGAWDSYGQ